MGSEFLFFYRNNSEAVVSQAAARIKNQGDEPHLNLWALAPECSIYAELPIAVQGSLLNFLFTEQDIQSSGHEIRILAKLFGQVSFPDHNISTGEALVHLSSIRRDSIGEGFDLATLFSLDALSSSVFGLEVAKANETSSPERTKRNCQYYPVCSNERIHVKKMIHNATTQDKIGQDARVPANLGVTKITKVSCPGFLLVAARL